MVKGKNKQSNKKTLLIPPPKPVPVQALPISEESVYVHPSAEAPESSSY